MKKYDAKNCPCPSACVRKGKCRECRQFHHQRGEQTYCEALVDAETAVPETPDSAVLSGRQIQLMDYGPCAG